MKKLRNILALVVVTSMATFLTGCGGGDGGGDSNNPPGDGTINPVDTGTPVNAPASLQGRQYTFSSSSGTSTIRFPTSNSYEITRPNGTVERGTFIASRADDVYTVRATPNDNPSNVQTIQLTFSSSAGGSFIISNAQGHQESGLFQPSSGTGSTGGTTSGTTSGTSSGTDSGTTSGTDSGTTSGTDSGTTSGTDSGTTSGTDSGTTSGTDSGTTSGTDSGTTSGTDSGTTSGTDSGTTSGSTGGFAPAGVDGRVINFVLATGPFAGANYNAHLSGATSGTFTISGGSVGAGTFTYTPNGNSAQMVFTYTGAETGDSDNFTLNFTSDTQGTVTGTQVTGSQTHDATGSFQFTN